MLDNLRILLAEDNPTNQLVAVQMLEALGAAPSVAVDGVAALEILVSETFDILLIDIEMPRMSGLELIAQLRETGGPHAEAPIIALTAYVMREHRDAIFKAGADGVIAKPIMSIDEFGKQILEIAGPRLRRRGAGRAEGETPQASAATGRTVNPDVLGALAAAVGTEALAEIVASARSDIRDAGAQFAHGLATRDLEAIRASAHVLSSLAGTVGAERLGELLGEVQAAAHHGDADRALDLGAGVPGEIGSVLAELDPNARE